MVPRHWEPATSFASDPARSSGGSPALGGRGLSSHNHELQRRVTGASTVAGTGVEVSRFGWTAGYGAYCAITFATVPIATPAMSSHRPHVRRLMLPARISSSASRCARDSCASLIAVFCWALAAAAASRRALSSGSRRCSNMRLRTEAAPLARVGSRNHRRTTGEFRSAPAVVADIEGDEADPGELEDAADQVERDGEIDHGADRDDAVGRTDPVDR
jgi:hypothetical protein